MSRSEIPYKSNLCTTACVLDRNLVDYLPSKNQSNLHGLSLTTKSNDLSEGSRMLVIACKRTKREDPASGKNSPLKFERLFVCLTRSQSLCVEGRRGKVAGGIGFTSAR